MSITFKTINDTYGHVTGDYVLKTVAQLIIQGLRTEDVLCRYGGEEFSTLLKETDAEEALMVAERIRTLVADHRFEHQDKQFNVTVSLGIATLKNGNFSNHHDFVQMADRYLYAEKQAGRNRTGCAPV
ncbi:MAG: GGDEF domain-containing protein [Myxococcota bacterium]